MSCFIGLSTFVCCTVLSCFIGMLCNVFKALEIQRNLIDRTVGFNTAELTVLRRSPISSVNSYLQFYTYLIDSFVYVTEPALRIVENCKSRCLVTQTVPLLS